MFLDKHMNGRVRIQENGQTGDRGMVNKSSSTKNSEYGEKKASKLANRRASNKKRKKERKEERKKERKTDKIYIKKNG